jgi:hypothetical protein
LSQAAGLEGEGQSDLIIFEDEDEQEPFMEPNYLRMKPVNGEGYDFGEYTKKMLMNAVQDEGWVENDEVSTWDTGKEEVYK